MKNKILSKKLKSYLIFSSAIIILFWIYSLFYTMDLRWYFILTVISIIYVLSVFFHIIRLITNKSNEKMMLNVNTSISQIPELIRLNNNLNPLFSLPMLRGSAISPDLANILVSLINERKPKIILECGSGSSTLIISYVLEKIGEGKIISLDHIEKFADETVKNLHLHKKETWADVLLAPLKKYEINNKEYEWYDVSNIEDLTGIDLLFIDGPPRNLATDSRYPALPLLINKLNKDSYIILDDTDRKGEQVIIKDWMKLYPNLRVEFLDTEKGTAILKFYE